MGKRRAAKEDIAVTPSSGNVFADLGLPEPEEELTKAQLASQLRRILPRRRLTQAQAAELMGIDQPKVSALVNGRLANFSSERLMRLLTALGHDVEITVSAEPRSGSRGRLRVGGETYPTADSRIAPSASMSAPGFSEAAPEHETALTRDFRETIQARARRDAAFRRALLKEAVDCMLAGDVDTGKTVLRDYINATVGFAELGAATSKSPKSLMRMLGPEGNPQARNLFEIVAYLQKSEGFRITTRTTATDA